MKNKMVQLTEDQRVFVVGSCDETKCCVAVQRIWVDNGGEHFEHLVENKYGKLIY